MNLKHASRLIGSLLAAALVATPALANPVGATLSCAPDTDAGDGRTPRSVVQALYEVVSGPAHARKDWERMVRLFAPGALVTPTWHEGEAFLMAPQSPRQFADLNDRVLGHRGFFENEVAQQVESFGHIAHVFSSYETRDSLDGPVRARGVNSFQMINDGKRWCVLSLTWDARDHPLPPHLERPAAAVAR